MILNYTTAHGVLPVLTTAGMLLATGSSWRGRRAWIEAVGLGTGMIILSLVLAWLPPVVFSALLPSASVVVALLVLTWSEWRFAPDYGQTGFAWAINAAARPTLAAGMGAAAGFWPIMFLSESPIFPLVCTVTITTGLIAAHAFDRAFVQSTAAAPRILSDGADTDGPHLRFPESN